MIFTIKCYIGYEKKNIIFLLYHDTIDHYFM